MSNPFTSREFVSDGVHEGTADEEYFPEEGVKMSYRRFEVKNPQSGFKKVYYKATISSTASRPMLQGAVYFEDGPNKLVATNLVAGSGLLMNETVVAVFNKDESVSALRHEIAFSNGAVGIWTCK